MTEPSVWLIYSLIFKLEGAFISMVGSNVKFELRCYDPPTCIETTMNFFLIKKNYL